MVNPDVIDRLPPNVWRMVFRQACTDGGYTGCALSSTSGSVRRLSAPTRFYSVTLVDLVHIQTFLTCLALVQQEHTETLVRHLRLSFLLPGCKAPVCPWPRDTSSMEPELINEALEQWGESKRRWDADFVKHVSHLFERVGPTLQTLLVLQSKDVPLPLVRYHFPALREITLLGDDHMFVCFPSPSTERTGWWGDPSDVHLCDVSIPDAHGPYAAPFPLLERVHIVYTLRKIHPWEKTLPQWAVLAPAVTHLRISQGDVFVASMLQDLLSLPDTPLTRAIKSDCEEAALQDNQKKRPQTTVYPSLRLVIVQPSRLPSWVSDTSKRDFDVRVRWHLKRIAQVCSESESEAWVTVLRSRRYSHDYWPPRLEWEWRDRMCGGGGCWTEDELDESGRRGPTGEPPRRGKVLLPLEAEKRVEPKAKWWKELWAYISRRRNPYVE
ncbi:hypothetical protein C8Q78DRAFT_983035 [Trametes maxima]|nr:hypothetical protein C8Q78DRAFT_983035 [Trametes maxima]